MKMLIILLVVVAVFVSACEEKPNEFIVPNTNLYFILPDTWVKLEDKEFREAISQMEERNDLPKDYKESITMLEQFNKYSFAKPQKIGSENRNTNLNIVTIKLFGEVIDLNEIVGSQIDDMRTMSGLRSIDLDKCPKLGILNYRCFTANVDFGEREYKQYQYLTIEDDYFVQFAFATTVKQDIEEIAYIVKTIKQREI